MNLFINAIKKKQLVEFAIGKDKYFLQDQYGEHSVIKSYKNWVLTALKEKQFEKENPIELMLHELYKSNLKDLLKGEFLLYHLHVISYLNKRENTTLVISHLLRKNIMFFIKEIYLQKLRKQKSEFYEGSLITFNELQVTFSEEE